MHYPRLFKPESIANVQIEIQIVDTHETLETLVVIGLQALGHHLHRTLLGLTINYENVNKYNSWSLDSTIAGV